MMFQLIGTEVATKVKRAKKNPISASDPMAEAGRKIFAQQYRQMRRHEDGSRSGEDIESVHRMRVAIRRMRTLFRLIGAHYRPGTVDGYQRGLRRVARALGAVRDLDVLILDLQAFAATLPAEEQIELAAVISLLEKRRADCRVRLNALFDSKQYGRFIRRCERLFKKRGRGARPIKQREFPHQVRHVLPVLLHDRMARVKAYDTVLPAAGRYHPARPARRIQAIALCARVLPADIGQPRRPLPAASESDSGDSRANQRYRRLY